MRPFLVLLLVALAIAAFFFAATGGSGDSGDSEIAGPPTVEDPVQPARSSDDPLVGDVANTSGPARIDIVQPPENVEVASTARSRFENSLTGSVVDMKMNPIAEAEVVLTRIGQTTFFFADQSPEDRGEDMLAVTDAKGEFRFVNVPPYDGYALRAKHPDYGSNEVGQVAVGEEGEFKEARIVLRPGKRVYGNITDVTGNVVEGAQVSLGLTTLGVLDPESPSTLTTMSNPRGAYEFKNVSSGTYIMNVTADGYAKVAVPQVQVSPKGDAEMNVQLDVAQIIAGHVSSRGTRLKGARIQAYSLAGGNQQQNSADGITTENGEFSLDEVGSGSYTLVISCEGYASDRIPRVEAGTMDVSMDLVPLSRISGKVIEAGTQKPVKKFSVRLRQPVAGMDVSTPIQPYIQVNSQNGEFTVSCPKAGVYVVEAAAPGYASCFSGQVSVADGTDSGDVVVRMTRGGVIKGRLVDSEGRPVSGAVVTSRDNDWTDDAFMRAIGDMYPTLATTREVRSRQNGDFVIEGLTPTMYQIEVRHSKYSRFSRRDIAVNEGRDTEIGNVTLDAGAVVQGTVYDPGGRPLAGSVVQLTANLMPNEFPISYSAKADDSGRFEFSHVRAGSYLIKAMRSAEASANPFQHIEDMRSSQREITVRSGQVYTGQDLRLGASSESNGRGGDRGGRGDKDR